MHKVVKIKPSWLSTVGRAVLSTLRASLRPDPKGIVICNFDGVNIVLDCHDQLQLNILRAGQYEPELSRVLRLVTDAGDIVVDIGANIGWHSLTLLMKRPDIRSCYAYEPAGSAYRQLMMGIDANNLQDRCFAAKLCLSDTQSTTTLKHFNDLGTLHSSIYPLADYPFTEEEVVMDTLDQQAISYDGTVAVIKCDVEGSERDVLRGAQGVLSGAFGPPPIWFLEANYETAGMGGFFPWDLIELAKQSASYEGFSIRDGHVVPLTSHTALRHGETLILAIPHIHDRRLKRT